MKTEIWDSILGKAKYKPFVNPLYYLKHNITNREASDLAKNKRRFVGEFYVPNLTTSDTNTMEEGERHNEM